MIILVARMMANRPIILDPSAKKHANGILFLFVVVLKKISHGVSQVAAEWSL